MTPDKDTPATKSSRWESLPAAEQAEAWEKVAPGTFARIMDAVEIAERHERRLAWAEVALRLIGMFTGFAIVVVLALVAKHLADKGAATQGAGIFGAGAASVISAAFALGRTRKS